ncbi:MAG TPA: tyrosine-type recombinase/integrase [Allocoleopsis sp.]
MLADFLKDKSAKTTRTEYGKDLRQFFKFLSDEPITQLVAEFLSLDQFEAIALVLKYKASMTERGLKESTINRRLAAIKSMVNFARKLGKCSYNLADIKGEKVQLYRDTKGVSKEVYKKLLDVPDRETLKGKRDYAILRLLWGNALRRNEAIQSDIKDFDPEARTLAILGKGKGSQKETITLSRATVEALQDWLFARSEPDINQPLFIALDRSSYGHRMSGTAVYKVIQDVASKAGLSKHLSPHRIRHSAITAALEATGGDVRSVQKLSRHADINILLIYDDNRKNVQGAITEMLSDLV